jgi:hypothetical protein
VYIALCSSTSERLSRPSLSSTLVERFGSPEAV